MSEVTEDVDVVAGDLVATGSIPIEDADAGVAQFPPGLGAFALVAARARVIVAARRPLAAVIVAIDHVILGDLELPAVARDALVDGLPGVVPGGADVRQIAAADRHRRDPVEVRRAVQR